MFWARVIVWSVISRVFLSDIGNSATGAAWRLEQFRVNEIRLVLSPITAVGGCSMSLALKCCLLAHFDCRSLARVGRVDLMLLPIRSSCNCLGCGQYLYAGQSAMIRVFTGAFPASCLNFSINHMSRLWQRIGTS